jgi:hypothetical protein
MMHVFWDFAPVAFIPAIMVVGMIFAIVRHIFRARH